VNITNKPKTQGFTIIEVVLVLAIAGLIFLIVFLALPALQRSQRDTARKNDASRMLSQLTQYQSNTQGSIPAATVAGWNAFIAAYLTNGGQSFKDPQSGNTYTPNVQTNNGAAPNATLGTITIYNDGTNGSACDNTLADGVVNGNGTRQVAVVMPLEQGGFYCQQN